MDGQKSHYTQIYIGHISQNNFVLNNYTHGLFHKVLALLSAQKNFASFGQSADERHLLATVPQLQGIHPGQQRAWKHSHYAERREFTSHCFNTVPHLSDASPLLSLLASDWLP